MNDEICRLNLAIKDAHSFYEDLVLSANDKKVIERIVVNILLGQFWTDLPHVKNTLKDILKEQHEVDDVIPKITILDEKNHKIRIKDEYESEFDPYLFYRAPAVQRDIFHAFSSKMKKDKPVDLVSGKRYMNQPEHLVAIQKGLFQSNLPNFLSLFLSKVVPLTTSFVRPALKLVLLNLQVVEDIFKSKKSDVESENLKNKVVECYLSSEFSNNLKLISSDESLKDCEGCIGQIRDLTQALRKFTDEQNHQLHSPGKMGVEEAPSQEEDKKNLARLKMQKLKEEFAKKQAKFAKSNSEILEKTTDTEETKIETESALTSSEHILTCQYCLDKIAENVDEYGVPIYVAFTNNFYDTGKVPEFEKFDSSRLAQTNFWPVISSCNHYYHRKCFVLLYKNSKKPSDSAKKHFSCANESYCSLCKTLCNSFLCVRENQKGDMQEEPVVDVSEAILFEPFTKQVNSLFKISIEKIAEMIHMEVSDEELELPTETLFLRAYTYFMEAFHLQEQSEAFEKDFNLYSMFFRKYVAHLKEKKIKLPPTRSFLSQVDLNTGQIIIPMDEVIKKQKTEHLQQYSSEDLLNNILFGVLDDMVPYESNIVDPIEVTNRQLGILKEYLIFKLIQSVSFVKGDAHLLFKDLKTFYVENKEFSSKFIREIIFPFQKIMLAFALNHNILLNESPFDDLLSILIHPKDDLEYLNRLLNETGILLSFDEILDQAIEELEDGKSEAEVLPLLILLSSKQSVIKNELHPRIVKYAPTSVKLPENYAEFNTKYFRMKCSLCKGYSQHLLSSICLICGEFMCQAYCDPKNKKFGNLNRHAGEYHMGLGLFLDVQHLSKTVLGVPINAIYTGKNVYIDKLGQAIQVFLYERRSIISSLDFKKFVLNEEFLQNLKDVINHHSMGKEVFKIARTANYYYHNGNL